MQTLGKRKLAWYITFRQNRILAKSITREVLWKYMTTLNLHAPNNRALKYIKYIYKINEAYI